ncbi:ATP synthase F0 subunit B [Planctomicrobium sp. SH668]|uniref:ATP synthase F0 subunit B n=1 Tax=Planctomicrobium sp. SH668 TaxID=3448126 RepID=UPI003F5BA37D
MRIWQTGNLLSALSRVSVSCMVLGLILGSFAVTAHAADAASTNSSDPAAAHEPLEHVHNVEHEAVGDGHGGVDYNKPPLVPSIPLFVFSLVVFVTFVFVMRSTVWQPLIANLDAREERVIKAEAEAKQTRLDVERLTAQAETRLAEVYNEVQAVVSKAREEAEAQRREIVSKAEADAARIKAEAIAAIGAAKTSAIQDLEAKVEEQVSLATAHVAGGKW